MSRVEERAPATFTNTVEIQGNSRIMNTVSVLQTDDSETLTANLNAGRTTIIPDVSGHRTYTLPAPVAGLRLHIVGFGALAADGHNVLIKTATQNTDYFHGAVLFHDTSETGQTTSVVWGDGNSNDIITIGTAEGFDLHFLGKDSTSWYIWGWIASETTPTIGD